MASLDYLTPVMGLCTSLAELAPELQYLSLLLIQAMPISLTEHEPRTKPLTRFLVACPQSGCSLLMRIFAESPSCAVTSRLILMGNYGKSSGPELLPDYRILTSSEPVKAYQKAVAKGKLFLVNKEELGNDEQKGECSYDVLPAPSDYQTMKPVFLIRDPIRVFDSWKSVGSTDMKSLLSCYDNLFRMQDCDPDGAPYILVYEKLVRDPSAQIQGLCAHWGLLFDPSMLEFRKDFGDFTFNSEREKRIYQEEKPLGLFKTVGSYSTVRSDIAPHGLLTNQEKYDIECRVGRLYMLRCWEEQISSIQPVFQQATWFAFDLDDTLHEFYRASGAAVDAVMLGIASSFPNQSPPVAVSELKAEYSKILRQKTSTAFVEGKTSHEYREDRIRATMDTFGIVPTDEQIALSVALYEDTLMRNLELKPGILDLLEALKQMNKKIAIITEGPQDAQERTVAKLGLNLYIDFLATTNKLGVAKVDGMFEVVLKELDVPADQVVMVGDSWERDMVPARKAGMLCVYYAEKENVDLEGELVWVNSLKKLELQLGEE